MLRRAFLFCLCGTVICAVPATNKSREGVILRCLFFVKCAVLSYTSNRCSYSLNVRVYSYTWLNGCASNHHMTSTPIPSENGPEHRGQANRLRVSNICQQPHITSSHPLNIKHISLSYLIIKQAKSSERLKSHRHHHHQHISKATHHVAHPRFLRPLYISRICIMSALVSSLHRS